MIARYSASIGAGTAVTFGLLFVMQHLIATGEGPMTDTTSLSDMKFVRVKPTVDPIKTREPPEPPPEVAPVPALTPFERGSDGPVIALKAPTAPGPIEEGPIVDGSWQSGQLLDVVIVAPAYPARALARQLEGYVVVEYTVTSIGTVEDVIVVASSNGVFERAAVEAAYKFKYKPRVIDGEAVDTPGVQNKFSFVLTD